MILICEDGLRINTDQIVAIVPIEKGLLLHMSNGKACQLFLSSNTVRDRLLTELDWAMKVVVFGVVPGCLLKEGVSE